MPLPFSMNFGILVTSWTPLVTRMGISLTWRYCYYKVQMIVALPLRFASHSGNCLVVQLRYVSGIAASLSLPLPRCAKVCQRWGLDGVGRMGLWIRRGGYQCGFRHLHSKIGLFNPSSTCPIKRRWSAASPLPHVTTLNDARWICGAVLTFRIEHFTEIFSLY